MVCSKRLVAAAALISLAGLARADYIKGYAYSVPQSTAQDLSSVSTTSPPPYTAYPGSGSTEIASFLANGINFSANNITDPSTYNLGGFLNSGGTASNITYMNGASASTSVDNTLFEFLGYGSFVNGTTYSLAHDDGAELYVDGINVLNAPTAIGGTGSYLYNGPTGTYWFELVYGNCCGGIADFTTDLLPSAAATGTYVSPEPSTALLPLAGLGLLAVGWIRRRRVSE